MATKNEAMTGATCIYYGKNNHCRCGCGGKYADAGTPLFKRYMTALNKLIAANEVSVEVEDSFINYEVLTAQNKAYTLYFKV